MKNIVLLDGKTMGDFDFSALNELGNFKYYDFTTTEEVVDRIKEANVIITNKVILNKNNLKEAKNLEIICEMATGYNNIEIEYAKNNSIAVTNVAGYSTNTVAQHTFAVLLNLCNKIAYYDNYVKSGNYTNSDIFTHLDKPLNDISGKTFGIIGLGEIGKKVARIAEAFGAKVIYYSTSGKNSTNEFEMVDFEKLLNKSDIISIHAPLNERTLGLINYEAMKKMKKSAILINMGRGPIVVEEDLAKAIEEDLIGGAALDVFEKEPMNKENALLKIKNKDKLILTPHIAWASVESRTKLFNEVIENIKAYYKGDMKNRIV